MAKNYQGILGNFSGKVGNVVGRVRGDRTVIAVYQPEVGNPQTTSQQTQRQKLIVATEYLKGIAPVVKRSMRSLTQYGTGWSATIRHILLYAITGTYPNQEVNAASVLISSGNVDLPYSPSAAADGTTITFTWADNSGLGNALATDIVCGALYNTDKKVWTYSENIGVRSDRNSTLAAPTSWSGDSIEVYMYVRRGYSDFSRSTHLAALPL